MDPLFFALRSSREDYSNALGVHGDRQVERPAEVSRFLFDDKLLVCLCDVIALLVVISTGTGDLEVDRRMRKPTHLKIRRHSAWLSVLRKKQELNDENELNFRYYRSWQTLDLKFEEHNSRRDMRLLNIAKEAILLQITIR
ncbi:hypothetical protein CAPTEDRAFT_188254 [Capitella teleta]|uniref:Uncharacterized protein n=1 Tax=Capitella teleta TaxID=283909 RepID=R7TDP9_CAPTE|nr:hypothetical protein CAPTEDRAFT_188254 [Capitella teleta]|eukprot:ELT91858.1 hypothetical protein CAPTEDRAFT_188254 [Capitella teleta]